MADKIELSLVIPVYNEEDSLKFLQEEIYKAITPLSLRYEVIYVDDASIDSSLGILKKLGSKYSNVRIISFKKNCGQSAAFCAGFDAAFGEWIATLDADLQNPPSEVLKLLKFKEEADFIAGVRKIRKDNFVRRASSGIGRFFRWLILGDTTKDVGCSLRIFKKEVIKGMTFFKNFHRFFTLLAKEAGFKIKEIEVIHRSRRLGKSKYGTLKRAAEGLFDLLGVFWLRKRFIFYAKQDTDVTRR